MKALRFVWAWWLYVLGHWACNALNLRPVGWWCSVCYSAYNSLMLASLSTQGGHRGKYWPWQ